MSTRTVYIKTALVGGTTNAVDGIDGDDLLDGDVCHAYVSDVAYQYVLDDDSGAAESSPDILAPDSNPGNKRWILQTCAHISDDAYAAGWDGVTGVAPSKNAVYDKIEAMISDDAYAAGWGSDTTHAASKKAIYDEIETLMKLDGTNLALGSDAENDMYYRDGIGNLARIPDGSVDDVMIRGAATAEWASGIKPEYGTWTPGVSFGGGTTGITYSATYNGGHYVVIGNLVIAIGTLSLTSKGTDTGNALITGLPVSTMDSDIYGNVGVSIGYSQYLTFVDAPLAMTVKNSTTIAPYKGSSGSTPPQMTNADFANITALWLVAVYRSA